MLSHMVRFYLPVHLRHRLPLQDIELPSGIVPAFSDIHLVLAAANREPRQFRSPDKLGTTGLTIAICYGFGIHHCIGAALAPLDGETVFATLAPSFSEIKPVKTHR